MGTLYFLLPIVGITALLFFVIKQIEAKSYLRRKVEADFVREKERKELRLTPVERQEHRYVDWYTQQNIERKLRARQAENDDNCPVAASFVPEGVAYRPQPLRRMARM
ncbi:MAG: hypothetical protein V2I48_01050 [Xanthomonadales bacterium]|jgi:hypothetical protein|nr:hypothetical protein [Xanthomonadales bacterium]